MNSQHIENGRVIKVYVDGSSNKYVAAVIIDNKINYYTGYDNFGSPSHQYGEEYKNQSDTEIVDCINDLLKVDYFFWEEEIVD